MNSLSAVDLLQFVVDLIYLLIFVVTAVKALRSRLRADIDIAFLFGAIGFIISATWITGLLGVQTSTTLAALEGLLILALPYLLLRLVEDFSKVSRQVVVLAIVGLVLSAVALLGQQPPYPLWQSALEVAYFFILEIYGALAFVRAARKSPGVTRRRMNAIAVGSLFLGFDIIGAGLTAGLPASAVLWRMLSEVTALVAGIAYYAGFAPPRMLRAAWQISELQAMLRRSSAFIRLPDLPTTMSEIEQACAAAMGARAAVIWLWDPAADVLQTDWNNTHLAIPVNELVCGRALRSQKAMFVSDLPAANPALAKAYRSNGAHAAFIAPVSAGPHRFGVLAVYAERAPIFAADDVELIQLLADQTAVVLENRALIEETARERARAEALAAVEQVNVELEARIRARTADLQEALNELEAFSYSVSHDLRSPLRTIDGFVQAFIKDFGPEVSPTGRDYLDRIRAATQRMGLLIDGLLRLSRVTRHEMRRDTVDLSALARSIIGDLRKRDPDRAVSVAIADGLVARGDEQLLRVALENLLENAWKFTLRRSNGWIELRRTTIDGETVYVVRDNGAGFDMEYADKLFIPFERLHGRNEFEGTGIGLATVQRIVRRHGGRIWGEGEPERGASFFFTLGDTTKSAVGGTNDDRIAKPAGPEAHLVGRG